MLNASTLQSQILLFLADRVAFYAYRICIDEHKELHDCKVNPFKSDNSTLLHIRNFHTLKEINETDN